jgi:DNA-binding MarR family transcriptional regulator
MDQSLGFVLNRTSLASKHSFSEHIKAFGISPEQWSVIYRVVENDGISPKELADSTYKDQGNLTRMVDRLVEKKYIKRESNENDRRAIKLFKTKKSDTLVKKIIPLSTLHNESLTNGLSEDEKWKLIELLNKVYKNIQKD